MIASPPSSDPDVPLPDQGLDVPEDPAAVFDAVGVDRPGRVCRHCLTRLRRHDVFSREGGLNSVPLLSFVEATNPGDAPPDREFLERLDLPDRLERGYTAEGRETICAECGACDPYRWPPTRSVEDARDHAINLSWTLSELGIQHDWLLLVHVVEIGRSRSACGGDDRELFRQAVSEAVQRARDA